MSSQSKVMVNPNNVSQAPDKLPSYDDVRAGSALGAIPLQNIAQSQWTPSNPPPGTTPAPAAYPQATGQPHTTGQPQTVGQTITLQLPPDNPQVICLQIGHDYHTKFGVCGICAAIIFFPLGILCCLLDRRTVCERCGHVLEPGL